MQSKAAEMEIPQGRNGSHESSVTLRLILSFNLLIILIALWVASRVELCLELHLQGCSIYITVICFNVLIDDIPQPFRSSQLESMKKISRPLLISHYSLSVCFLVGTSGSVYNILRNALLWFDTMISGGFGLFSWCSVKRFWWNLAYISPSCLFSGIWSCLWNISPSSNHHQHQHPFWPLVSVGHGNTSTVGLFLFNSRGGLAYGRK